MSNAADILKRFKTAKARKETNWRNTYEEVQDYSQPHRQNFSRQEKGQKKNNADIVFDSTAQSALQKFVSNLQSALVPPMKRWVKLAPGQLIDDSQRDTLGRQLEKISDVMFSAITNSNFDTQISEAFTDLAVGTGALLILKGTQQQPLRFVSVPLDEIFLEEGPNGRIEVAFRQHKQAARTITDTWEDVKMTPELKRIIDEEPDKQVKLVDATLPAKFNKQINIDGKKRTIEVDGFRYVVIDVDSGDIIVERLQESNPWVIFRWSVVAGEIYGRGPLLFSLPDIKTVNKLKELILKNASLAVSGAYTVADDGIVNIQNIRIEPGALIPVTSNPGSALGPTISPLPRAGDFNVAQLLAPDLQKSINDIMMTEPLGPIDLPVKSATEVSLRQQEFAKRSGAAFGRLQFELITPLVNRILFILNDLQLIDLGPFRVDGQFIGIEHISPLAQAQDEEQLMSIIRYAELISNIFGQQGALALINPKEFTLKAAELLNVDKDVVATEEQIAAFVALLSQVTQPQTQPQPQTA